MKQITLVILLVISTIIGQSQTLHEVSNTLLFTQSRSSCVLRVETDYGTLPFKTKVRGGQINEISITISNDNAQYDLIYTTETPLAITRVGSKWTTFTFKEDVIRTWHIQNSINK